MPSRSDIDEFLAQDRIAIVGVSRDPKHFANAVYRALRDHGIAVYGVNPYLDSIEGDPCCRRVALLPDVDGAIVMVGADDAAAVVEECADRGITRVWLHRGAGRGAVTDAAVSAGRQRGLTVIDGACPLMFLGSTGFVHRLHRLIAGRRILTG